MTGHSGELFALLTAACWTASSQLFEDSSRRVGSLPVNLLRLPMAFLLLGVFNLLHRGLFLPTDASAAAWGWLLLSGFLGFALGDLMLFKSYVLIGSRVAMLVQALSPVFAALFGRIFLAERLGLKSLAGMGITLSGVALVILTSAAGAPEGNGAGTRKLRFAHSPAGLLMALGSSVCSSTGLVVSKYGMAGYDAFAATQIRLVAGMAGFTVLITLLGRWRRIGEAFRDRKAMVSLSWGAVFGPFLGVSFCMLALQRTRTGIASTLMALVPVMIIPPAVIFYREKVKPKEALGALLAVGGAALLFL
jgi:drug/metabolite transporter (DMT)-like permease